MVLHQNTSALPFFNHGSDTAGELIVLVRNALKRTGERQEAMEMDKVSKANSPPPAPNNSPSTWGARQAEYAFVKRKPRLTASGSTAAGFLNVGCENSYCVGSISCVGCVTQLRKLLRPASSARELRSPLRTASSSPLLRPASSTELRPVASQLRSCASSSCASPISVLSRTHRITRRAATAMKVKRTAERLADLIKVHKRALRQLVELSTPQLSTELSNVPSTELSNAARSQLCVSPNQLRPVELSVSASRSSEWSASSDQRPCELRPPLRDASSGKRESPLVRFALVASKSASVVSVASPVVSPVLNGPVLGRSPKPTLH
jgi:hypothetical protein